MLNDDAVIVQTWWEESNIEWLLHSTRTLNRIPFNTIDIKWMKSYNFNMKYNDSNKYDFQVKLLNQLFAPI